MPYPQPATVLRQWDKAREREDVTIVPAELGEALAKDERARLIKAIGSEVFRRE